MVDPYVTCDGIIIKNASDLDNEDDKRVGNDDNGEKEDDNWRKRVDKGAKNFDGRVEEENGWEKSNEKKSDEDHSGSAYLRISGKLSPLNTPKKLSFLDTPKKLLDTMKDAVVILDEDKVLDTMEDVVVISDKDKILRLIVTLALQLYLILLRFLELPRLETSPLELPLPFYLLSSRLPQVMILPILPMFWAIFLAIVIKMFFPWILPPPLMTFLLPFLLLFSA